MSICTRDLKRRIFQQAEIKLSYSHSLSFKITQSNAEPEMSSEDQKQPSIIGGHAKVNMIFVGNHGIALILMILYFFPGSLVGRSGL